MYLFAIYFCAPKRSLSFKPIKLKSVQTNINKSRVLFEHNYSSTNTVVIK